MSGRILYTPEAKRQLDDLDNWITSAASPETARAFIGGIMSHIEGLLVFPRAARDRTDVRAGMMTSTYRKRTVVAYTVDDSGDEVVLHIIGVFHGGQDWESALRWDAGAQN